MKEVPKDGEYIFKVITMDLETFVGRNNKLVVYAAGFYFKN
jgi:hypothetical protein